MMKCQLLVLAAVAALVAPLSHVAAQSPASSPPAAAPPPTRSLDFSGLIFGNYQWRTDSAAKAATGGQSPNRFELERVYLTFRMPVGDRLAIRATTDIFQNANGTYYNGWTVRLKYGYLQYSFLNDLAGFSALARIGILHTVVIDHEESFWPRYLGSVGLEKYGFFASADAGAALQVSLPARMGEIYGTVTNGPGYTAPENDRFKDFAARLTLTPLATYYGILSSLTISPWYYRGSVASRFATNVNPITAPVDRNRWGVLAGVHDPRLIAAVHYARRSDGFEAGANTPQSPRVVTDSTGAMLSAHAIVKPFIWKSGGNTSSLGVIGRWDSFKRRTGVGGAIRFITAGLQWEPSTRTAFSADYQTLMPQGFPGLSPVTPTKTWYLHWMASF